jgi:NADH:ubiquinone oxidoreductase subunit K
MRLKTERVLHSALVTQGSALPFRTLHLRRSAVVPLSHYLTLGAIIFFIGVWGVLTRRNAVIILLSIELMFNAVNITVVAFSRFLDQFTGQIFAIFVITVAAAEATIGLAIVIALYRGRESLNVDEINLLKW